jgi:hypothetical protein
MKGMLNFQFSFPRRAISRVRELSAAFLLATLAGQLQAAEAPAWGMAELARPDRLPVFKHSIQTASVSSYDRTGGNDDGFSGKYSFVREEKDGLVIADLKGPGVIYRIWTPTPTDDLVDFYFDGEATPRIQIPFRELFLGQHAPFLSPLSGYGAGGFYSYTPLPYKVSCKVLVRAKKVQFYQINYAQYDAGAGIESYTPTPSAAWLEQQAQAQKLFQSAGADLSAAVVPSGSGKLVLSNHFMLAPGATATLAKLDRPGRIAGLRVRPAAALANKDRSLTLRISFDDGTPSVLCPAGDFFGYAWGRPAMKSLFIGVAKDTAYCYFPMPYRKNARVELVAEQTAGEFIEFDAEVVVNAAAKQDNEGYFTAVWRRENPTTTGQPFTFVDTRGRGHLVGVILQSQGLEPGKTLFFEGDDQTTIDGQLLIQGTGSEDFFNGGWYDVPDRWEKRLSFPLSGCLGYEKPLGRTGAYRFFIGDTYVYRESLKQTIEHSGEGNNIPTDYCAVTYLYTADRPSESVVLPPLAARAVNDPKEIIFPAWWQIPLHAFCFNNATLERRAEKFGQDEVRFLSLKATGEDFFGSPFLEPTCEVPASGRYDIYLEAIAGPAQGKVQLFKNEVAVAPAADFYRETRAKSARVKLGALDLEEGPNHLMLKLPGKNEKASGLGLDLIQIVCVKAE